MITSDMDPLDLDSTSQSHIYKALKRAESDYGHYERRLLAGPRKKTPERIKDIRSRTSLEQTRTISNRKYSALLKHSRAIMNKEIKLSVSRSRRWAGVNQEIDSGGPNIPVSANHSAPSVRKHLKSHPQKLMPSPPQLSNKHNKLEPEADYHRTICGILTNKNAKCSYSHVARVIARSDNHRKATTALPYVCNASDSNELNNLIASKKDPHREIRRHLDITLPSVHDRNKQELLFTNDSQFSAQNQENLYNVKKRQMPLVENLPLDKELVYPKNLNFSDLCHAMPHNSFIPEPELQDEKRIRSLIKKKAHRVLAGYFNQSQHKTTETKVMVIHLPNPNIGLESVQEQKKTPKLLLR